MSTLLRDALMILERAGAEDDLLRLTDSVDGGTRTSANAPCSG